MKLLDAKYRDLWEKPLPRNMLYQLAVYALGRSGGGEAVILFPTLDGAARKATIEIRDPLHESPRGYVVIRPVKLLELAELFGRESSASISRRREALAWEWAGG